MMTYAWMVFLSFFCRGISSFEWTSTLQDGADLYACVGDSIKLPWDYSVQDGEVVEDIKWYFNSGNDSRRAIAAVVEGDFLPLRTSFSDRIHHVRQAGLALMFVTGQDSGEFSVSVSIVQGSSFAVYNLTALLVVAEDPLIYGAESLSARQERVAVYDNNTGQLHVQLSCGGYVITGHPPLSVEWTFPSGEKHLTSIHINGFFVINLPNPVEGGSYTCRLFSKLPPASCLPQNASVLRSSSVTVDEVRMRLSLVEAEQEILKNEKRVEIDRLTEENRQVKEFADSLQNQLENKAYLLQNLQDYLTELDSNKVLFDARLSRDQSVNRDRVILDHVVTNEGSAYNASTGVFTAPFNGTYFFVITAYSQNSNPGSIASLCDGVTCFCQVMTMSNPYNQYSQYSGTCQAALYRSKGETVWFRSDGQWSLLSSYTSFSGFSVHPDIDLKV